jgi:formylglycine-generating enzyme required for sulfatase activity
MVWSRFAQSALPIACATAIAWSVAAGDDARPGKDVPRGFDGTKTGQMFDDNSLSIQLVWIAPGKFTMGSPKGERQRGTNEDQVEVTLTKGFWLARYEVTQFEWQTVMQTSPWAGKEFVKERDDDPATHITWDDAMKFCEKLTKAERQAGRLPADWKYTLPTEAQWEYACRAGTTTRFSFGNNDSELGDYAWYHQNAVIEGQEFAHAVGQKKPNPWGLSDMHGGVWEWCRDRFAKDLPGGTDPEVAGADPHRVLRGGCWNNHSWRCRSATRNRRTPDHHDDDSGFRIAAVPSRS